MAVVISLSARELEWLHKALSGMQELRDCEKGSDLDDLFCRVVGAEKQAKIEAGWYWRCDECGVPIPVHLMCPPGVDAAGKKMKPLCMECSDAR